MPVYLRRLARAAFGLAVLLTAASGHGADEPAIQPAPAARVWPGEAIYTATCAGCHEGGSPKAPPSFILRGMSPGSLLAIMDHGVMKDMAAGLTQPERQQVAEYLTGKSLADYKAPPPPKQCGRARARFDLTRPPPQAGWGYDNRRFVPASVGGLTASDLPRLKLKWAFAFPDATQARSQPVLAMGAVFVGSHGGQVYALDLATGCVRWMFQASAEVRNAIVIERWDEGRRPPRPPRAFFGDMLGNVYALDAQTGRQLWRTRPEGHKAATITGTVAVWEDRLIVPVSSLEVGSAENPDYACCNFRGSVVALDLRTGALLWQAHSVQREARLVGKTARGIDIFAPSGAPVWGSPTIDARRSVLYFGTGENYTSPAEENSDAIIAVDLRSGQRRWSHQIHARDAWNNSCMYRRHPNCPSERGYDQDIAA